jgi:ABC-type methionine transport system ATPase subunit
MDNRPVTVRVSRVGVRIGGAWILEDVSFDCSEGEWTVIHGPSGAGKSTLLRAINGLCPLAGGRISVLSTRLPGRPRREARAAWRQTGTVLQEVALFETKTALQNVLLALGAAGLDRRTAREKAAEWLDRLGLGDKLQEYPSHLSGGQRQRVALARAFAVEPRLLLLDEPTSALDRTTALRVLSAVRELSEAGATVVMSSHRTDEVREMCDQWVGLQDGSVSAIERRVTRGVGPRTAVREGVASATVPGRCLSAHRAGGRRGGAGGDAGLRHRGGPGYPKVSLDGSATPRSPGGANPMRETPAMADDVSSGRLDRVKAPSSQRSGSCT